MSPVPEHLLPRELEALEPRISGASALLDEVWRDTGMAFDTLAGLAQWCEDNPASEVANATSARLDELAAEASATDHREDNHGL